MQFRRLVQFRLSTLLFLLVVACAVMGLWHWKMQAHQRQLDALERLGDKVKFVRTRAGEPEWLRPVASSEVYQDVIHLSFHGNGPFNDLDLREVANFPRLERLSLHGTSITNGGMFSLSELADLDTLSLKRTAVGDDGLRALADLPNLKMLQLSYTQITGKGLRSLARLERLERLELAGLPITTADLEPILKLKNLRHLDLNFTRIDGAGVRQLAQLTRLEKLYLSSIAAKEVRLEGLQHLKELRVGGRSRYNLHLADLPKLAVLASRQNKVSQLTMRRLPKLTSLPRYVAAADLESVPLVNQVQVSRGGVGDLRLVDMPGVRSIEWYTGSLDRDTVKEFGKCKRLRRLAIHRVRWAGKSKRMEAGDLLPLESLPQLSEVSLIDVPIADGSLESIGKLADLKTLRLQGSATLTSAGIRHLESLGSLTELWLDRTKVDDDALSSIGKLTSLKKLSLHQTSVTGRGLLHLGNLSRLHWLSLTGCKLADGDLPTLSQLPLSLRVLRMEDTPIGDAGVRQLVAAGAGSNLEQLWIHRTQVTVGALESLSGMSSLHLLAVGGEQFALTEARQTPLAEIEKLRQLQLWLGPGIDPAWMRRVTHRARPVGLVKLRNLLKGVSIEVYGKSNKSWRYIF